MFFVGPLDKHVGRKTYMVALLYFFTVRKWENCQRLVKQVGQKNKEIQTLGVCKSAIKQYLQKRSC